MMIIIIIIKMIIIIIIIIRVKILGFSCCKSGWKKFRLRLNKINK